MIRSGSSRLSLLLLITIFSLSLFTGCTFNQSDALSPEIVADKKPFTEEVQLKDQLFLMELALTPLQRAQGLMGRKSMADNRGMLFVFSDTDPFPAVLSFWMKNCLMPIDVIFISGEGLITAIHEMQPSLPDTPDEELITYSSIEPVQFAIELRGGLAAELGLQIGDMIELRSDYLLKFAE